jgi:hypothetical protein
MPALVLDDEVPRLEDSLYVGCDVLVRQVLAALEHPGGSS